MTPEERAARPGDPDAVHVLMPHMGYACGGNILTKAGRSVCGPWDWDQVTCPDCRAPGQDALLRALHRMQGHDWPPIAAPAHAAVPATEQEALL